MTNNFIERKVEEFIREFEVAYHPRMGEFLESALTEMLSEVEKCVPERKDCLTCEFNLFDKYKGFNECREEILTNLSNLKK